MQQPQQHAFRVLTAGEVISQTFEGYRRLFRQIFPIPATILLPTILVEVAIGFVVWLTLLHRIHAVVRNGTVKLIYASPTISTVTGFVLLGVLALLVSLMQLIANAAVVAVIGQAYVSGAAQWRSAVVLALRRCGSILWAAILLAFVFLLGSLVVAFLIGVLSAAHLAGLGVFPALAGLVGLVWLVVGECVLIAVILFERRRGVAALKRSFLLVRGRWWPTLGVLLVIGLATSFAQGLLETLIRTISPTSATVVTISVLVGWVVGSVLVTPLLSVATSFLYFDSRNRKEGLDLRDVAHLLGVEPGPGAGAWGPQQPAAPGYSGGWQAGGAPPPPYQPPAPPGWQGPAGGPPGSPPGWPPPSWQPPNWPPPNWPPPPGDPPSQTYPPPGWPPYESQQRPASGVWGDVVPPPPARVWPALSPKPPPPRSPSGTTQPGDGTAESPPE
jgi:hypothetical protein